MQKSTRVKCLDPNYRENICRNAIQNAHSSYHACYTQTGVHNDIEADFRPYYSIPVKSDDRVIAVLVLYLKPGHKQDLAEIVFLRTVANVLSLFISLYKTRQHIKQLTHYDQLTGLPNKNTIKQHLSREIDKSKITNNKLVILCIDLDGLKRINDSLGHKTGDGVINVMAQRLLHCTSSNDMVGRWGSDEFVIVLHNIKQNDEIFARIQNIYQHLLKPLSLHQSISFHQHQQLVVSFSIGISVYPEDGNNAMSLIQNANMALHKAKSKGGNNHQFYTAEMNIAVIERLAIETGLRTALEQNQFELYYQPILDIKTQQITGVEALIRWHHPTRGMIPPDKFIPIAEDCGLIIAIGQWVLEQACLQCTLWHKKGLNHLEISVNLSAKQFRDNNLQQTVSDALQHAGLDAAKLTLELTESSIMENGAETKTSLHRLKDIGVSLSIDDFGTGYSSLAYLKDFPIDKLKIDRSFVQDVDHNADDQSIVRSIIALGHNLKLSIVAEGIEKGEHMDLLESLNCEEAQGYYISQPLPESQFIEFVLLSQTHINTESALAHAIIPKNRQIQKAH